MFCQDIGECKINTVVVFLHKNKRMSYFIVCVVVLCIISCVVAYFYFFPMVWNRKLRANFQKELENQQRKVKSKQLLRFKQHPKLPPFVLIPT